MTTHDFGPLIAQANLRAQRRFHAMVRERAYANPYAPETLLYTQAERRLRELEAERAFAVTLAAFESRGLEMDELMEADLADNGLPDVPLAEWSENMLRAMWGDA
jgi:hypothetical protein